MLLLHDQTKEELNSLVHFLDVCDKFFFKFSENYNLKTFRQLQDAALTVFNKSRETALAEMFNIELKFTCDCLKIWFEKNIKLDELDEETNMSTDKTMFQIFAVFVIFLYIVTLQMVGLIMCAKQNIYF